MTPREKLAAKRFNERTKLTATAINPIAIALLGASIIIPGINSPLALLTFEPWVLLFVAIGLHLAGRVFLGLLRSEE